MVLVKKWPFFQLERKNAFLSYKNKKLTKSRKIDIFPKGLTYGFGPKMAIFPTFFLGNIGQENVFYDIVERKNAFLGYKNKKLKESKIWHFSKGVDACFWSKNDHFSNFVFLGKIGHGNVFYDIVERKNAFLGYKKKKLKKLKNWHFSKGVDPWFLSKNGHFSNFVFSGNISQAHVLYYILEQKTPF